jgi:hypothetical protein
MDAQNMKTPYWIAIIAVAFIAGMAAEYLSAAAEVIGPWKCVQ